MECSSDHPLTSLEVCAGAGGQALGLERAGFRHMGLVEIEPLACATLRLNRPHWKVIEQDLRSFDALPYCGVDLLAGGVPCPPFSRAGKQLGASDERDLFPEVLRLADECHPRAIMLENVRGLLDEAFIPYRKAFDTALRERGYYTQWELLNASAFGVCQHRPRVVLVALLNGQPDTFQWP